MVDVPLKTYHVRMTQSVHDAIAIEAQYAGVSFSEFVREAALARAAVFYARRDGSGVEALEDLLVAARSFDQAYMAEGEAP